MKEGTKLTIYLFMGLRGEGANIVTLVILFNNRYAAQETSG